MQSSRELVNRALKFENPERIPRDLWALPWAEENHPKTLQELREKYPIDIISAPRCTPASPRSSGDAYAVGEFTDDWGCAFTNIQEGIIGEVKTPVIKELHDWRSYEPPYELLTFNEDKASADLSRFYEGTEKFVLSYGNGSLWERYQFLRGSENSYLDVLIHDDDFRGLLQKIHDYNMRELEFWAKADVDAIRFLDDWGAQSSMLISPDIWREFFKPLYKEYCDLGHAHGKFIFMHSDGYIADIYPDLIEIGVDAINSQLFVMDFEFLEKVAKGKITFWGEIDRQHILPSPDPNAGRDAVHKVTRHLYDPSGGIIAQFELSPGSNGETALAIFDEWEKVHQE
jgi:uroporphyrinogen decarboxylase